MIASGIVLYNPQVELLLKNVNSIYRQVDYVVLVDNGSEPNILDEVKKRLSSHENVHIVENGENKGIAYALNRILKFCSERGSKWVITFDQDSISPDNLVESYKQYVDIPDVAIITPFIKYNNKLCNEEKFENGYIFVEKCITSAAMTNVEIAEAVGGFDDKMFIDYVDFEFCIRLRKSGYKILKSSNVKLIHQLGELRMRNAGIKNVHVGNHNSTRKYYYSRNVIYCHRKHKDYLTFKSCIYEEMALFIKTFLFESDKYKKIKAILRGIKDGMKMKL